MKHLTILTLLITACVTSAPTSTDEQLLCTVEDQASGQCTMPLLTGTRQYGTSEAPDGIEYAWACHSYSNGISKCSVVLYTPGGDLMVSCTNVGTCAVTPCGAGEDLSCDP